MKMHRISEAAVEIAQLALKAMLYEAACFPSPGLVSPVSQGAHRDMDFFLFLDSAVTLHTPMIHICEAGIRAEGTEDLFRSIRELGVSAERSMFEVTGGINTHKGMLFVLGILASVGARAAERGTGFGSVRPQVMKLCAGLVESELGSIHTVSDAASLTHGERIFAAYGADGVRGEMERGLPAVYDHGLPVYEDSAELPMNDRLVHTLIEIMRHCEDTTVLYRHDPETLGYVRAEADRIMALGGMKTPEGRLAVEQLNQRFTETRISPGGSADLLGATVFLSLLKHYLNTAQA